MSKRVMWTGPFADFAYLHDQMDRIAQEMLTRTNAPTVTTLPVDIYDSGEDIIVQAYVPGVRAEHLDIQIDDDVLTISGSFPQLYDQEESATGPGRFASSAAATSSAACRYRSRWISTAPKPRWRTVF
jgi:HSP20 family molecular chaperone IbpA